MSLKILTLASILSMSFFVPSVSKAQSPQSPELACDIIHRYEAFCGNLDPDACVRYRQGFDYWNNTEHRRVWDDYYQLCGQDTTRHSHECVEYLGISAQCTPSVEAPPEPVNAYQAPMQYRVADPAPQVAVAYREPIQYRVAEAEPTVAVAYREPIQYQVCCQVERPQAEQPAAPVGGPTVEVPGDPEAVPSQPSNPIVGTPSSPQTPPSGGPAIADGPQVSVAIGARDAGDSPHGDEAPGQEIISGKVTNGVGGSFQMSGAGCSFQGQTNADLAPAAWILFAVTLGLLRRKRSGF